ncbi:MAG: hypothetical protein CFE23_06010 [Flavobacterium sp. BFFFF1]|uniref:hypothetical protein n=1 Tax=Flavobacterium sp. BFFFF1 TaxID=2015557 RepID=UPI000BC4CB67|nr:hypothetical protein [Flavobacterium sp. BFFFF1]OYU81047.1 MAG: hypothetical protein CFE23_06010 [Flavobacterium sp. BFFFF1]
MKKFVLFTCCLLLYSCQYFSREVPSKDALVKQQLDAINWKEVDEFPSTSACDSLTDKSVHNQCFLDFMTAEIQRRLSVDTLTVKYAQLDTIAVKVTVFRDARLKFEPQFPENTAYDKAMMDSIIQSKLTDFPIVSPALKRGIPVNVEFTLPVILNVMH